MSTVVTIVILYNMGKPESAYELLRSQEGFFSVELVGYLNIITFTQLRFYQFCQKYNSKTYYTFIYQVQNIFLNA
jgi:hypothetical protein